MIIPESKIDISRVPYPKEAIEHLVEQIVKLSEINQHNPYNHQIDESIEILNEGLRLLIKPVLIAK